MVRIPVTASFQFQSGAIERTQVYEFSKEKVGFQFQSGAIERKSFAAVQPALIVFQFQSGAIESGNHRFNKCVCE